MKTVDLDRDADQLTVTSTIPARVLAGAERGVMWAAIGFGGLLIMFSPDVVVDAVWGRVEGSTPISVLILSVAGLALFVGAIGGWVRAWRRDRWTFDRAAGVLRFETRPLLGRMVTSALDFDEIQAVSVDVGGGLARNRLTVVIDGERRNETLVASRFGGPDLRDAGAQIAEFLRESGAAVELRGANGDRVEDADATWET